MLAWAPALLTPYKVHGRAAISIRSCTNGPSFVFSHASLQPRRMSGVDGGEVFPSKSAHQLWCLWQTKSHAMEINGGSVLLVLKLAAML